MRDSWMLTSVKLFQAHNMRTICLLAQAKGIHKEVDIVQTNLRSLFRRRWAGWQGAQSPSRNGNIIFSLQMLFDRYKYPGLTYHHSVCLLIVIYPNGIEFVVFSSEISWYRTANNCYTAVCSSVCLGTMFANCHSHTVKNKQSYQHILHNDDLCIISIKISARLFPKTKC